MLCLPEDAVAIRRLLPEAPAQREVPGSAAARYLDHRLGKPWGYEQRVYDDSLVDVWWLELAPGKSTSLHCHPRKATVLLCLRGEGFVTDGRGRRTRLRPGSVVSIEQGAMHRTTALTPLTLVEAETPRDKCDLLRVQDEGGRRGSPYEDASHVVRLLAAPQALADGPPCARLRRPRASDRFAFALERSGDVARRPEGFRFAISLDTVSVLRRELTVSGPHTGIAPSLDDAHLTVRVSNP